jgi:GT2 family glycosyltransferase
VPGLERVGVVVVTYRSASTVGRTIDALPREELGGLVVVDNASPDDTVEVVRATGAHLVQQENLGFGAGNNRGAAELRTELVLFLNPDAVIQRADLERLVAYLDDHPTCAVVGPRVVSAGHPTYSAGRLPSLATELRPLLPHPLSLLGPRGRVEPGQERSGPVGYVEGACFLVRREALLAVGGFDPGYFLYCEEIELSQRLRRRGLEVHLCAEAVVEHAMGVSTASTEHGGSPHLVASKIRYLRRWHGERTARAWAAAARASWWLRERAGRVDPDQVRALRTALAAALAAPPPGP